MVARQVKILLIEDSEIDALLLTNELKKSGISPIVKRIMTESELRYELANESYDVVISDYILPQFNGMEALSIVREKSAELPFILVSGKIGEEQAADAIKNGANDYLMKSNLFRSGVAVERALEDAENKLERRKTGEELERSLMELRVRTSQLDDANRKMHLEIAERRKAQEDLVKSKEHLKSVLDSALELIFSVDQNLRISTWNKSMQNLTGFGEKEIVNRSIDKLQVFSSSVDLVQTLRSRTPVPMNRVEFTLTTRDNVKKVVQAVSSTIRGNDDEELGILLIGKDITPNIEEHGRLMEGMGYLIPERTVRTAIELFLFLSRTGKKGLFITRANPSLISSWFPSSVNIETVLLTQERRNRPSDSMMEELVERVERFASDDEPSVILLDGGHYLVASNGFNKFLEMIFHISEVVSTKRAILLVRMDPKLLDEERMAFLENELMILPSQKLEDVVIDDDIYTLLRFVQEQNDNNSLVSLKKISSKFRISHVTVAKRIDNLEMDGLIYVKKIGKQRAPFLTEKGKALLAKRKIV